MKYILPIVVLSVILACRNDPQPAQLTGLEKLLKDYEMQPNATRAEVYLDSLNKYLPDVIDRKEAALPLLENGINVSIEQGLLSVTPSYLLPLLRNYPDLPNRLDYMLKLGDVMYALRKRHASNIVYKYLIGKYPNSTEVAKKKGLIEEEALQEEDYLTYLFDRLKSTDNQTGIDKTAAMKYVDAVEALALTAPDLPAVPNHLYGAAEVARSLRTFPKAMSLYDWILEVYPQSEHAPNVLFIKGFILEQDYKREDEAREIYQAFIDKYPKHKMAESAKFLLENLGKSNEEILREIEQRKKQN